MGHFSAILLILGVTAYVQGLCTFKEGAENLVSVDYWTDEDGNTAVDRIQVKMRNGKYLDLMDGCKKQGTRKSSFCTESRETQSGQKGEEQSSQENARRRFIWNT